MAKSLAMMKLDMLEKKRNHLKLATSSRQALEVAGFDPILETVTLYDQITGLLAEEVAKPNGGSAMKVSALVSTKQRCASDLLRYGYARVFEGDESMTKEYTPITINMAS